MTIGVIFFAEDPEGSFFNDIDVWRTTLHSFGVDFYIIVDDTSNKEFKSWSDSIPTHVVNTLDEAFDVVDKEYNKHKIVYMDINGDRSIGKFGHPPDAIYLFGPDTGEVTPRRFDFHVRVPILQEIWSTQICALVLNSRRM